MTTVLEMFVCALVGAVVTIGLAAQDPALLQQEQKLTVRAVAGLHAAADALQAQKQHARALALRREIWLEYAEDDSKARERTGFVKVGDLWRKDDTRLVLDKDLKPDGKGARELKKIDQQLATLEKELEQGHRELARALTTVNELGKAQRHWQRVLRFHPGDKEAAGARALDEFEGFTFDPAALHMLRRARAIRGACDWLNNHTFQVTVLEGRHHPLLAAAGITNTGVRSDHFELWGVLPLADLQSLAMDCERALLLARTLFGTAGGEVFWPRRRRDLLFVDGKGYGAVLDQCAGQFTPDRLAFLKQDVDLAFVQWQDQNLRLYKTVHGMPAWRDQAVRGVVQDAVGVLTDGLWEGIGHAACGLLFGQTLTFMLEQKHDRTVSSWQSKPLLPDLAVWMQIAEESAWAKSDTRTSELVLLSAARFSNEQRVKAWAMCHYLLHVEAALIWQLDQSQSPQIHTPPEVENEFQRRTGASLPKLDADWREHWARGAELRKAMLAEAIPAKAADRKQRLDAKALVDLIDGARAEAEVGPAGYYFAVGPDVVAAQQFDILLQKAEALQKKKPKEVVPLPELPGAVGRTLLRSTQKDAAAAVAAWMTAPVTREALLHPGRELFAANVGQASWLLDLALPPTAPKQGLPLCWPRHGQRAVAGAARAGDLGPRALAALQAVGVSADDVVGMPLTLHFLRDIRPSDAALVRCAVYQGDRRVDGVFVHYDGAPDEADSAAGLVAFVPRQPFAAAATIEVAWELPPGYLDKKQTFPRLSFTVQ
ncbi:MAG: hypothetical protein IT455_17025 [Planctomycetes bacterium]|nr:hypothetical protein [Planctomycetota bacterium]